MLPTARQHAPNRSQVPSQQSKFTSQAPPGKLQHRPLRHTASSRQSQSPAQGAAAFPAQKVPSAEQLIKPACWFDVQITSPTTPPQQALLAAHGDRRARHDAQMPLRHWPTLQGAPSSVLTRVQALFEQTGCVHWSPPGHSASVQQPVSRMHRPRHAFSPGGHCITQLPPEHTSLTPHARLQAPQFAGSDRTATQRFPHLRFGFLHFFFLLALEPAAGTAMPYAAASTASERRGRRDPMCTES